MSINLFHEAELKREKMIAAFIEKYKKDHRVELTFVTSIAIPSSQDVQPVYETNTPKTLE